MAPAAASAGAAEDGGSSVHAVSAKGFSLQVVCSRLSRQAPIIHAWKRLACGMVLTVRANGFNDVQSFAGRRVRERASLVSKCRPALCGGSGRPAQGGDACAGSGSRDGQIHAVGPVLLRSAVLVAITYLQQKLHVTIATNATFQPASDILLEIMFLT